MCFEHMMLMLWSGCERGVPWECCHIVSMPPSRFQLWFTMGGLGSTSINPSKPVRGAQVLAWAKTPMDCKMLWVHDCIGRMWHNEMRAMPYCCHMTTRTPWAVDHSGWPCFHLNTPFITQKGWFKFDLSLSKKKPKRSWIAWWCFEIVHTNHCYRRW